MCLPVDILTFGQFRLCILNTDKAAQKIQGSKITHDFWGLRSQTFSSSSFILLQAVACVESLLDPLEKNKGLEATLIILLQTMKS